ncbi:MAG: OmpA family protein [Verrucomicrobiota bacterium]
MKKIAPSSQLPCLLCFSLLFIFSLTSCQKSGREVDADGGGYLGTGGTDDIEFAPGPRPDSNPDNADYATLSNYTVYFSFDSFSIRTSERPKLEAIASYLTQNTGSRIVIAGHTDSRGTTDYNVSLGERRALATRDYLLGLGVSPNRMTTVSYGEERPAAAGENESAWTKNRRAAVGLVR